MRQYLKKHSQHYHLLVSDEYVNSKKKVENYLEAISSELKASNATSLKKKTEKEQDDLDVLFAKEKVVNHFFFVLLFSWCLDKNANLTINNALTPHH